MKTHTLLLLVATVIASCSADDKNMGNDSGNTEFPKTGISSYDANSIPPKSDPLPNLIEDTGFENNGWLACGGAEIVENSDSRSGNNMARLSNAAICDAANRPFFSTRNAILIHPLAIEELPELLTVSFWIKSETAIPDRALTVYLTNSEQQFLGSLAGGQQLVTYFREEEIGSEWLQVKLYYENDGSSLFLGMAPPFSLAFELEVENGYTDPITFFIDDVKVSSDNEIFTQPDALPDGLLNYAGNSRILFFNNTTNVISSMQPNGDNVVGHDKISTEFLNSTPQWYDKNSITVGQKVFYPENPNDLEIVPGSGTDLFRYDITNTTDELVYQTVGDPGRYSPTSTTNNKEAIDLEVRRTAWNLERNLGAITVCGRARTPNFVSDDVCTIHIVNATDFSLVNDELRGFNAVWSSTGRLAYYNDNGIFVAEVSGNSVSTNQVFWSNAVGGLKQEVDWSPDGKQLVVAHLAGGVTIVNGSLESMFTISIVDLDAQTTRPILNVDHGTLFTNLSWSPDGKYILYSLQTSANNTQVWWLEIATGKTGPLTNTFNASAGYWRK